MPLISIAIVGTSFTKVYYFLGRSLQKVDKKKMFPGN